MKSRVVRRMVAIIATALMLAASLGVIRAPQARAGIEALNCDPIRQQWTIVQTSGQHHFYHFGLDHHFYTTADLYRAKDSIDGNWCMAMRAKGVFALVAGGAVPCIAPEAASVKLRTSGGTTVQTQNGTVGGCGGVIYTWWSSNTPYTAAGCYKSRVTFTDYVADTQVDSPQGCM